MSKHTKEEGYYISRPSHGTFLMRWSHCLVKVEDGIKIKDILLDSLHVTNDTGMLPKQLQKSHAELLEQLESCLEGIEELNGEFQEGWDEVIEKTKQAINNAKP